MKLARILSLLTGIVFACHFSAALAEPITAPAGSAASPVATGLETAVVDRGLSPTQNGVLIKASPSSATDEIAGTRTLTLTLPSGTDNGTLKIVLNGKNVTSRFSATSCNDGVCETATLTAADGLIDGKNVLYAIAKKSDSTLVSSRLRFEGGTTPTTQARSAIAHSSSAASVSALPTNSTFLPPSVRFSVAASGWQSGKAWVTVGTQQSYPDASYSCSGSYTAIVLDRKTLVEKTAAPESSPQCLANGTAVSNYLKGLSSSDLVVLGTKLGQNTDAPQGAGYFDTNAIGGTAYNCNSSCTAKAQSQEVPLGYLIIGASGAALRVRI